jgi:hypothetical protein
MSAKALDKVRNFIQTATAKIPAPDQEPSRGNKAATAANAAANDAHQDARSVAAESAKKPKIWHPQQEKLLKQWAEIATSFRWMHHHAHLRYSSQHFWFTLPVIVMSSVTGTMNFAQGTFPPDYETYVPLIIGSINLIAGIITTIASYLRVSELSEGNRVASVMFGKLSRNIRVELLLPVTERTMDGADFIAMCRSELDRLTEQAPDIPKPIELKFLRQFNKLLQSSDKDKFYSPELQDLHPVEIYTGDVERKQQEVGNVLATAALAFKHGVEKHPKAAAVVPTPTDPESLEDMLPPVPAVALQHIPTVSSLLEAKEQRANELNQLSSMHTVSSRLRNKAHELRSSKRLSATLPMGAVPQPLSFVPAATATAGAAAAANTYTYPPPLSAISIAPESVVIAVREEGVKAADAEEVHANANANVAAAAAMGEAVPKLADFFESAPAEP